MKIEYRSAVRYGTNDIDTCICWINAEDNEALINLANSSGVGVSLALTLGGVGSMWAPVDVFMTFIENAKLLGYEFWMDATK